MKKKNVIPRCTRQESPWGHKSNFSKTLEPFLEPFCRRSRNVLTSIVLNVSRNGSQRSSQNSSENLMGTRRSQIFTDLLKKTRPTNPCVCASLRPILWHRPLQRDATSVDCHMRFQAARNRSKHTIAKGSTQGNDTPKRHEDCQK